MSASGVGKANRSDQQRKVLNCHFTFKAAVKEEIASWSTRGAFSASGFRDARRQIIPNLPTRPEAREAKEETTKFRSPKISGSGRGWGARTRARERQDFRGPRRCSDRSFGCADKFWRPGAGGANEDTKRPPLAPSFPVPERRGGAIKGGAAAARKDFRGSSPHLQADARQAATFAPNFCQTCRAGGEK